MTGRSFIEIYKSSLRVKLHELNIRSKYHDRICQSVKDKINDSLSDFIVQAIEEHRIIESSESLEKYFPNQSKMGDKK